MARSGSAASARGGVAGRLRRADTGGSGAAREVVSRATPAGARRPGEPRGGAQPQPPGPARAGSAYRGVVPRPPFVLPAAALAVSTRTCTSGRLSAARQAGPPGLTAPARPGRPWVPRSRRERSRHRACQRSGTASPPPARRSRAKRPRRTADSARRSPEPARVERQNEVRSRRGGRPPAGRPRDRAARTPPPRREPHAQRVRLGSSSRRPAWPLRRRGPSADRRRRPRRAVAAMADDAGDADQSSSERSGPCRSSLREGSATGAALSALPAGACGAKIMPHEAPARKARPFG